MMIVWFLLFTIRIRFPQATREHITLDEMKNRLEERTNPRNTKENYIFCTYLGILLYRMKVFLDTYHRFK